LVCNGTITLNDEVTFASNNITLTGAVGGAGSIQMRAFTLTLSGAQANTFTGGITVSNGTLILNKSVAGGAIRSNLNVLGGTVRLDADNQILSSSAVVVTLSSDGLLNLNGNTNSIFALKVNDVADVTTGTGTLIIASSIERDDGGFNSPGTITGNLSLSGGTREIRVADTDTGTDLDISAAISNGAVRKTGAGTVLFSGTVANTYTGMTTVEAGTLVLDKGDINGAILGDLVIGGSELRRRCSSQATIRSRKPPATPSRSVRMAAPGRGFQRSHQ
jgi:fibronectin-binding autotransporter adhesin